MSISTDVQTLLRVRTRMYECRLHRIVLLIQFLRFIRRAVATAAAVAAVTGGHQRARTNSI